MAADLHLHTHFSDGTFSPEELAARAARERLTALALTDHDTVEGCPRMAVACREHGLEFVVGTELTAEIADTEIHLLGYGLDLQREELLEAMGRFQRARQERIHEMVARVNRLGLALEAQDVLDLANCQSPGRPHVARALVARGHCSGVDEAFSRFLRKGRPAWVPKAKLEIGEAIRLVHDAGGLAVLAHPGISQAAPYVPALVEVGLDGIECYHTKHAPATAARYVDLARQHRLLITGGSDCHGMAKGQPLVGTVRLEERYYAPFREALRESRSAVNQGEPGSDG